MITQEGRERGRPFRRRGFDDELANPACHRLFVAACRLDRDALGMTLIGLAQALDLSWKRRGK